MATLQEMKQRNEVAQQQQQNPALVAFKEKVALLKGKVADLLQIAPKGVNAKRIIHSAITLMSQEPKLAQCSAATIYRSVSNAIGLGLDIVGGQGYLVPRFNKSKRKLECTFVPGWQGLVGLVGKSGIANAWTGAVFEGDHFDWQLGDQPFLRHRPMGEDNPAKITHFYSIGRINGNEWPIIEVWTAQRAKNHRDKFNEVGDRHYSYGNWEMYGRKVVLLQVIKYLPKSQELINAIQANDAGERGSEYVIDGDGVMTFTDDDDAPLAGDYAGEGDEPQGPRDGGDAADATDVKFTDAPAQTAAQPEGGHTPPEEGDLPFASDQEREANQRAQQATAAVETAARAQRVQAAQIEMSID